MSTVTWDDRLYEHVSNNAITVGTDTPIEDAFDVDANAQMLVPFDDGDAGTENVRVRSTVYLPPMFVSMMLESEMSPRHAWEHLGGVIVNENKLVECKPIIDWIKVALTRQFLDHPSRLATEP